MIFIETTTFTKLIGSYLTDDEYRGLQGFLFEHPDAGKIVRGSGGVRKLRWAMAGKGKSGGIRVIYYWKRTDNEIWLLTVYGKSERESIPSHILKQIAEEIKDG
jgi:mRNA-degrading endonuclease RelE of RelBE toxin-antitoxin system